MEVTKVKFTFSDIATMVQDTLEKHEHENSGEGIFTPMNYGSDVKIHVNPVNKTMEIEWAPKSKPAVKKKVKKGGL